MCVKGNNNRSFSSGKLKALRITERTIQTKTYAEV